MKNTIVIFLLGLLSASLSAQAALPDNFPDCVNAIVAEVADSEGYPEMLAEMKINNHLEEQMPQFALTNDDVVAIYAYARDFFEPVNTALWKGSKKYECFTKRLDAALKKLPDYSGIVFRGAKLPPKSLAQHLPGKIVLYPAYTSSSYGDLAGGFDETPVVLKILSKHGKKIAALTVRQEEEREVLFQRNTSFRVTKRQKKSGRIFIEMEELD